jgi:RNA polymerase sigma-B factor
MTHFGNIFLSRDDLDSLSAPKNRLEPQYADAYNTWREKNDDSSRENLLHVITPAIDRTVHGIHGSDQNYMKLQGKILAMKAMDRYDPEQSSLETYLAHQLMPLRRTARQQMNVLGIPDRLLMVSQQLGSTEIELQDELGRMPTTAELADKMHISTKQIERIRQMTYARNTGSFLTPDEEGTVGGNMEVARNLPAEYRHQYVLSALRSDPKSVLIYEIDNGLNGRQKLSVTELADKLGLSPGAVSQRRNRITEIVNNTEKEIYG